MLADNPPAGSIIVGEHREWLALEYLTAVWQAEPLIDPRPLCQPYFSYLAENTQPSHDISAIYLTRHAAEADPTCLADQHRYAAGANLIRVQPVPNTQLPDSTQPAALKFGPELRLLGFEVHPSREAGPLTQDRANWQVSLYWQAEAPIEFDYTVSVRPLADGALIFDEKGEPLIQDHQPVWNSYPTSRWSPGEIVRDDYVLYLPEEVVPDAIQIVVYRSTSAGFENLGDVQLDLSDAAR